MDFKSTLAGLLVLIKREVVTQSTVILYTYYHGVGIGNTVSIPDICDHLRLARDTVVLHTKILTLLGLIELYKQAGKPNCISSLEYKSSKQLIACISARSGGIDGTVLNTINILKEKFNRIYNKSVCVNIQAQPGCVGSMGINAKILETVKANLPVKYAEFRITSMYFYRLKILDDLKIDIPKYVKWFIEKKITHSGRRFTLGLFLYAGILTEFQEACKKSHKLDSLKNTASGKKDYGYKNKLSEDLKHGKIHG